MKKSTKTVLALLCAAMLIAASVIGTYAYLTSKDEVTNTFTVGNVQIKLDEAKVNEDGTPVEGAERVDKNDYHLLPGHSYTKDPTVTVLANSEDCYVRLIVTINKAKEFADLETKYNVKLEDIFTGTDVAGYPWVKEGTPVVDETANTITYEFRYENIVAKAAADAALTPLFTGFKIPGDWTNEDVGTIAGLQIKIVAEAIQADGFDNAQAAWDAFPANP